MKKTILMVSGVLAGTESLLLEMEIESTKEVLELYQQKLQSVQGKINNNTRSLAFRDQDFEYLLEVAENEVIKTPQNKILDQLDGSESF